MPWFENDTFWQAFYPIMFGEARFAGASGEVERLLALAGITPGVNPGAKPPAVLDLCCGPARHSLVLAQKGFQVTGVDRSSFLLGKARERIAAAAGIERDIGQPDIEQRNIELVKADMRDFVRPAAFDLALSLFTSFGYFETREQDFRVLENVRASLKNGGAFVMDLLGAEILASKFTPSRWHELASGEILVEHSQILPGWSRIRNQWMLVNGDRARTFEFEHNLYSGQELLGLLERAGFADVQLFGSLEGTPYDSSAARLVVLGRAS